MDLCFDLLGITILIVSFLNILLSFLNLIIESDELVKFVNIVNVFCLISALFYFLMCFCLPGVK